VEVLDSQQLLSQYQPQFPAAHFIFIQNDGFL